jgi:DNA-binding transcriptional ArsR family regulator
MVIQGNQNLDAVFAALADPTQRAILSRLAVGEASVNEIAAPFEISQPAVSKHLKVLEQAGLIERDIDKQRRPARLKAEPMPAAAEGCLTEPHPIGLRNPDQLTPDRALSLWPSAPPCDNSTLLVPRHSNLVETGFPQSAM